MNLSILKVLLGFFSTFILLICTTNIAFAEWTEWLSDTEASYTFQDNINHAVFDSAIESDHIGNAIISAGRAYQFSNNTRFFANILIDGSIHQNFDKLILDLV